MLEKFGIGMDIVEVKRFREKPFTENKEFYKKIFSDSEIEYCLNRNNPSESFAVKFAIKESVIKAIKEQISLLEILTEHISLKPVVSLPNNPSYRFLVSVSHEQSFAVAVVISEEHSNHA